MPNYVSNTVTFDPKDVDKVQRLVMSDDSEFDFNRIIPMPESLMIHSGSCTYDAIRLLNGEDLDKLKERYPDEGEEPDPSVFYPYARTPETMPELRAFAKLVKFNQDQYGHGDWYDWAYANWGTKWNACKPCWSDDSVYFDTAWSDPEPVFVQLAKLLGITFTVECEEESLAFCSVTTYSPDGKDEETAEGLEGLKLLGYSREEVIERYSEDWLEEDPELMEEINKVFG